MQPSPFSCMQCVGGLHSVGTPVSIGQRSYRLFKAGCRRRRPRQISCTVFKQRLETVYFSRPSFTLPRAVCSVPHALSCSDAPDPAGQSIVTECVGLKAVLRSRKPEGLKWAQPRNQISDSCFQPPDLPADSRLTAAQGPRHTVAVHLLQGLQLPVQLKVIGE